nr:hypothetical protein [Tanacetum cinerariifolium]
MDGYRDQDMGNIIFGEPFCKASCMEARSLPPTNLSKLLITLLVLSLLSMAWIMATALSLSLRLQIVCGRYYIRIPFRRSSNAVRTSVSVSLLIMKFIDPHQPVLLVLILVDKSSWIRISSVRILMLQIRPVRIQLSKVELLLVDFNTQLKVFHTSLDDDASCKHPKRDVKSKTFLDQLIIVTSYCNPIQMLVAIPFHNLEFCDSNDSPLGINIASRFPVNSETVELLTFTPPVRDSPEGVLVIVYWLLYLHSPRHQVFNPLDMPVICYLRLRNGSCISAARSTSSKILEVVVDEVCKWNNTTTLVVRLLPSDIQALLDFYTTPSPNHK